MARKPIRSIFAGNIRRALHQQDLAINSLADFAGVSRSQLYDVLSCRKGASIDWVDKIAAVLDLSSSEMLRDNGAYAGDGDRASKRRSAGKSAKAKRRAPAKKKQRSRR